MHGILSVCLFSYLKNEGCRKFIFGTQFPYNTSVTSCAKNLKHKQGHCASKLRHEMYHSSQTNVNTVSHITIAII